MHAVGSKATQPSFGAYASAQQCAPGSPPAFVGGAVAADEPRGRVEEARAGDEDMGEVARHAPSQREGFGGQFGIVGLERIEGHDAVKLGHQAVQSVERIVGPRSRLLRERAQRAVDVRERAVAQIHLHRQPLDRAVHDAGGVAGLDLAARGHREALDRRPVMRERADEIAVRVLRALQRAVDVERNAPAEHVLAVEAAWGEPQSSGSAFAPAARIDGLSRAISGSASMRPLK